MGEYPVLTKVKSPLQIGLYIFLFEKGTKMGRGGLDTKPDDARNAPVPPPQHEASEAEGRQKYRLNKGITTEHRI